MKTLSLSLLRIGDFFQQVHLYQELEQNYPNLELHIVAFNEIKPVEKLFPKWNFYFVPRMELQKDLVERDHAWYRALHRFEESLSGVFAAHWDLILNPTHTSFSARLMDCFSAQEKRGVQFEMGKTAGWNDSLRYLNDHYQSQKVPSQTLIEITAESLGLPLLNKKSARSSGGHEIWLNPLTSDVRKNWPMESWQRLAEMLTMKGHEIRILGAPSEANWLSSVFLGKNIGAWSFSQLKEKASDCRLLVSGDTSVPHFLALERTPMLTLFLGPANPYKTPPWLFGTSVMSATIACSPCEHRGACTQVRQVCEDSITPSDVFQVIEFQLGERALDEIYLGPEVSWIKPSGELYEKGRFKVSRDRTSPVAGAS